MTGDDLRARFITVTTTDGRGSVTFSSMTEAGCNALADRLAAAIKAIPRHRRGNDPCTYGACMVCAAPWPCPTENVRAALVALDADR